MSGCSHCEKQPVRCCRNCGEPVRLSHSNKPVWIHMTGNRMCAGELAPRYLANPLDEGCVLVMSEEPL